MAGENDQGGKLECVDLIHFGVALAAFTKAANSTNGTTPEQKAAFGAAAVHFGYKLWNMNRLSDPLCACMPHFFKPKLCQQNSAATPQVSPGKS